MFIHDQDTKHEEEVRENTLFIKIKELVEQEGGYKKKYEELIECWNTQLQQKTNDIYNTLMQFFQELFTEAVARNKEGYQQKLNLAVHQIRIEDCGKAFQRAAIYNPMLFL